MSDTNAADASPLRPGTRLGGIYEIDRRIASGGMGDVYRGRAIETGAPVAIKVIRTDLADNGMALSLSMFRREAIALNDIQHEAIVRYYVFANDPDTLRYYLAMEFVDGQPLSVILREGPLSFQSVHLLQQRLASGLYAAHKHGIIHRDVSPDNVLVPNGDCSLAKIIDFGIARDTRVGAGTIIGSGFAGKYNYVPPEQLGLYGEVTPQSDIYSLGLVLAQCLTGHPLDMGGSQFEVVEKRRVVPDLRAIDVRFRPLIERMLQPNPEYRPASMGDVAAWAPEDETSPPFGRAARDRARTIPPAVTGAPKPGPARGRRLSRGMLAILLLFSAGGAGFYFLKGKVSPPGSLSPDPPVITPIDPENRPRNALSEPEQRPPPPSLDTKERIIQFLKTYSGGDCFVTMPPLIENGKATIEGFGSSVAPFDVLDLEFKRLFGFDATILLHLVTPPQCPAINFLARLASEPSVSPQLNLDMDLVRGEIPITGSISGTGNLNVYLQRIADDGMVDSLTDKLKLNGTVNGFNFALRKDTLGPAQLQLLLAVVSSKPLEALKSLAKSGARLGAADQVFARALAEAEQSGQIVRVSARYFWLAK